MKNTNNKFSRCLLPGYDYESEKTTFIIMMIMSGFCCLIYDFRYSTARDRLYYWSGDDKVLNVQAVMPDFKDLLGWTLGGFLIAAIVCLMFIGVRYHYLHKESKSIYLIRRLPSRGELFRRCAAVPLYMAAICLIWAFCLLVLYYLTYMTATPDQCLAPDQWAKIWR